MSEAPATPTTRAEIKKSAKAWSLNARREFVLLWTIITALTLVVVVARTPSYHEALTSQANSAENGIELVIYTLTALGFIISATLLARSVMIYHEQLIRESRVTTN